MIRLISVYSVYSVNNGHLDCLEYLYDNEILLDYYNKFFIKNIGISILFHV